MGQTTAAFIKSLKHPFKFRMFLLSRLPNAYFAGLRIKDLDETVCRVSVPYKWFTKNPFRSTYFACLSMAAEMSTGALCLVHLHERKPPVSMLVVRTEAEYFKKATGKTIFTCEEGLMIKEIVEQAIERREAKTFRARSIGKNAEGLIVAEFFITWSFKVKGEK
ncbi:MAG TPA: DUF4442 domain-containing protein [Chitinophagaceae bacterium]|jgi:uncharacterized protein DUF4442|nr:DUF4442 domain-containing protein [Chitinophagaceae bacterium]